MLMPDHVLETTRIKLSPFTRDDAPSLHAHWTAPEVRQFLWDDKIISLELVDEVIEASINCFLDRGAGYWMIRLHEEPSPFAGFAGFRWIDDPRSGVEIPEVLCSLDPEHWGKGLAVEALSAVIAHLFSDDSINAVYAGIDPPNLRSSRLVHRLGMKFAFSTVINDIPADYFVLTRDEFHFGHQKEFCKS